MSGSGSLPGTDDRALAGASTITDPEAYPNPGGPHMEAEMERRAIEAKSSSSTPGLGELFRQLAKDTGDLLRHEIQLAKMELGEAASTMVSDVIQVAIALAVAGVGALALVVAMILGIGALLDGAYWAGALITGGLLVLIGGLMALRALKELGETSLKPEAAVDTLKEDREWAKEEVRALARGVSR